MEWKIKLDKCIYVVLDFDCLEFEENISCICLMFLNIFDCYVDVEN